MQNVHMSWATNESIKETRIEQGCSKTPSRTFTASSIIKQTKNLLYYTSLKKTFCNLHIHQRNSLEEILQLLF